MKSHIVWSLLVTFECDFVKVIKLCSSFRNWVFQLSLRTRQNTFLVSFAEWHQVHGQTCAQFRITDEMLSTMHAMYRSKICMRIIILTPPPNLPSWNRCRLCTSLNRPRGAIVLRKQNLEHEHAYAIGQLYIRSNPGRSCTRVLRVLSFWPSPSVVRIVRHIRPADPSSAPAQLKQQSGTLSKGRRVKACE